MGFRFFCTKTERESTIQNKRHTKNIPCTVRPITKEKSPVNEWEEHRVKNEGEINESHKSKLNFEYEVYLLNYTK